MAADFCFLYGLSKAFGPRQSPPSGSSCTRLTAQNPRAPRTGSIQGTRSIEADALPLIEIGGLAGSDCCQQAIIQLRPWSLPPGRVIYGFCDVGGTSFHPSFMASLTTPSFCSLPSEVNTWARFFSTRKRIASPISIFFFPPHSLAE